MLEMAFYLPWIFFFFIGALDWGFYAQALISVENAARIACLYTSSNSGTAADSATACTYVLKELQYMPNVGSATTTCSGTSPIRVTASSVTGPDGNPASQVTVTYTTINLVPIPNLMQKGFTWNRSVTMELRSNP